MAGLNLCNLGVADYDEMLALWQAAGLPVRAAGRDGREAFARQMAQTCQRVVGARDGGGRLVGVVLLTHDGRKGWINRLAVDPAWRRRGVAQAIIAEAERWFAEDAGLEVWAALIEPGNRASRAVVGRTGYQEYDLIYVSKRLRSDA